MLAVMTTYTFWVNPKIAGIESRAKRMSVNPSAIRAIVKGLNPRLRNELIILLSFPQLLRPNSHRRA